MFNAMTTATNRRLGQTGLIARTPRTTQGQTCCSSHSIDETLPVDGFNSESSRSADLNYVVHPPSRLGEVAAY
jgi:hypothetical protein